MRTRDRLGIGIAGAAIALGVAASIAPAAILPGIRFSGSFGHTSAISSVPKDLNHALAGTVEAPVGTTLNYEDLSDRGGRSLRLAMMAPVSKRVSLGVEGWTDDLLSLIVSQHVETGAPVDAEPLLHRSVWGLGWRMDADVWQLPQRKSWRMPPSTLVATGTAGMWRVTDDRLLRRLAEDDALGWSLGMGWNFQLPAGIGLGPAFRYARVFNDRVGRYVTASLDWNWR